MTNRLIDTVIFDFHGTLTDHNKRLIAALSQACEDLAIPQERVATIIQNLEYQLEENLSFKKFLAAFIEPPIYREFWQRFTSYRDSFYFHVAGLHETVAELRAADINILFLTNGTVKDNNYARAIGERDTYTNILWNVLVNQWHLYSGKEGDQPLIMSVDDFTFIARNRTHIPPEIINRLKTGKRETEGLTLFHGLQGQVCKPSPILFDAVGKVLTLVLEKEFVSRRTLFVTDYNEDATFGLANGMPTLMFVKGIRQYAAAMAAETEMRENGMVPYFHLEEIPYFCQHGCHIQRSFSTGKDSTVEIQATYEEKSLYSIKTQPKFITTPRFEGKLRAFSTLEAR